MEGFFPEKFLDDTFRDESLENQSDFLQCTAIPRTGSGQQSFHAGSSSHNSLDEDEPAAAAYRSDFLHSDFLGVGFGQESSQRGLNSNEGAFAQYSDLPVMGSAQENSCSVNVTDHSHGASPAANRGAFVPYREPPRIRYGKGSSNVTNTRKRMIDFLKRSCPEERSNMAEYDRERGFRHMINERMRRKRQRQGCLALHSVLPFGTKNDITSVVKWQRRRLKSYKLAGMN